MISLILVTLYSGVAEGALQIHFCDWWSKYTILYTVSFQLQNKPQKVSLVLKRDLEAESGFVKTHDSESLCDH